MRWWPRRAASSRGDGFEATTIADIAEAADLGFGTFYRYFPDKEAVLEASSRTGARSSTPCCWRQSPRARRRRSRWRA